MASEMKDTIAEMGNSELAHSTIWWAQRLREAQLMTPEATLQTLMDPNMIDYDVEREPNATIVRDSLREVYARIIAAGVEAFGKEIIREVETIDG